jgi:hypothetical protein
VKERVLLDYARTYGLKVFVETGTYYGDMVAAMKPFFDEIYSIELSSELFAISQRRFRADRHVHLVHGDSATEVEHVVKRIDRSALFWLDGHFSAGVTAKGSKDTPVFEELAHIFAAGHLPHVVVIDDARCFGTNPEYPTLEELLEFVRTRRPDADITVESDCVRIAPKRVGRLRG